MKNTYSKRLDKLDRTFAPNRVFIAEEEIQWVRKVLELEEMDEMELHNIRDMAVMFFTIEMRNARNRNDMDTYDAEYAKQSATVAVIDRELWNKGYEV